MTAPAHGRGRALRCARGLLLVLLLAGCDRPAPPAAAPLTDAYGNLIGPIHAPGAMARHALMGVRLHMAAPAAEAALVARGFSLIPRTPAEVEAERDRPVRRRRFWIVRAAGDAYRFPEHVTLSYVQMPDGGWIVAAIAHHQRITAEERRAPEATRGMLIRRFGQPSLWKKEVWRGELWDEMDYVTAQAMQDRDGMDRLRACHQDWQCEMVLKKNDCREPMRRGSGMALKISFASGGNRILYELSDFGLLYAAQAKSERFMKLDLRGAFCAVPAPGGELPIVVTVPE